MFCLKKGNVLRQAFEDTVKVLGYSFMQSMIYELKVQAGVDLNDSALSLGKLHEGIKLLYGAEIAEMIIEETILKMEKIADEQMRRE
ncbi:MAG TPA: hypothetical protein VHK86_02995 [Nitrososphaera sp.]|nr:hypothetical protein [Nitrososphaera sp.]